MKKLSETGPGAWFASERGREGLPFAAAVYQLLLQLMAMQFPPRMLYVLLPFLLVLAYLAGRIFGALMRLRAFRASGVYYTGAALVAGMGVFALLARITAPIYIPGAAGLLAAAALLMYLPVAARVRLPAVAGMCATVALWQLTGASPHVVAQAPVYFAVVWMLRGFRANALQRPHPVSAALLLAAFLISPINDGSYVAPDHFSRRAILEQPGVEVLFEAGDGRVPYSRRQIMCDGASGTRVVVPESPAKGFGLIDEAGEIEKWDIERQVYSNAVTIDGYLHVVSEFALLAYDVAARKLAAETELRGNHAYYLHYNERSKLLAISGSTPEVDHRLCYLLRYDDLTVIERLPHTYKGYECLPLGDDKLIVADSNNMALVDLKTNKVIRNQEFFRLGAFYQAALDTGAGQVYLPVDLTGFVYVYDAATLKLGGDFQLESGLRNFLIDSDGRRAWSWNHLTGEVKSHPLPLGPARASYKLGPALRSLDFDCGGDAILATTSIGGFRIPINGQTGGE